MKKVYSKPVVEIEVYELDTNIAANCGNRVTLGPEAPGKTTCSEFEDAFDIAAYSLSRSIGVTPFYSDGAANCDCYYTSGGQGYFTS